MFIRVAAAMSVVAEPLRKTPTPEAIARAERAIREARDLIRGAPGTKEAREARYWAFRYLELLGEHEQAEREFDAYLSEVVEAQGVAAALKILDREGIREEGIKNFTVAFQRFRTMLAFAKKGPAAATAYARMANVHAWLHQHELAVAAYRKALSFGPDAITARDCYQYLVRTGISNRDSEQALLDAKALAALPGNEATKANDQTMLGMVLEKTEGPVKAARHYRDILNKYPDKYTAAARWRLREIENNIEDAVLEQDP